MSFDVLKIQKALNSQKNPIYLQNLIDFFGIILEILFY